MEYKALYRKYRPTIFEDVVGQKHITDALSSQVRRGTISHAYLFTGSRGTGKTTCAKIFARAINCENAANGSPCGRCDVCQSLENDVNMDILELDAASNNKVDDIREVRDKVTYPPLKGKYKVFIIDEVHMLTDSAFNALLKTLEEPPSHVVFILATTEVHKIPQTILSRCMRFDFKLVSVGELKDHLKQILTKEGINITDDALLEIALSAEGSVRDMLSICDSILAIKQNNITLEDVYSTISRSSREDVLGLASAIIERDLNAAFNQINNASAAGKNMTAFAKDVATAFRDLVVVKTCKASNDILNFTKELFEKYNALAEKATEEEMLFYMQVLASTLGDLRYSLSPRTLLENAAVSCVSGLLKKN